MKTRFVILALLAMCLGCTPTPPPVDTIVTGKLTYDPATNIITGTDGSTYLGWDQALDLTYTQVVTATSVGGKFADYHIANKAEAYRFYNLATDTDVAYKSNTFSKGELKYVDGLLPDSPFGSHNVPKIVTASYGLIDDHEAKVGGIFLSNKYISIQEKGDSRTLVLSSDKASEIERRCARIKGCRRIPGSWLLVGD